MLVSSTNDVKQYNLTQGRSLPEWLDERKRRKLLSKDVELRRRIELIQDFDMPSVSGKIEISDNGEFICATGTYKPRIKCFDVNQLGLKFERCFDQEPVAFKLLSEDYSKMIFLHCDRYVEIHAQFGRYYRLRIPRFGRDLVYHPTNCDVYFVGDGSEVHRLNLEQGRFLNPLQTDALSGLNVCALNPEHLLFMSGSVDGKIEAWDPRCRERVGVLDCALEALEEDAGDQVSSLPQISALAFRDGLNFGVGTSTGKILLYDLRASKPLVIKDHMYGIPIKKVLFHSTLDQVISMDAKVVKIWDRQNGKAYTSIESSVELNDLAVFPGSGLMLMTCEQPKMQVHYIPSMGPSPRWCSFLDNITDEMEESEMTTVYDDYKFITKDELEDLALEHLIGTKLLRAYMHGFFMDARLYRKAKSLAQPYTLDKFLKEKINAKMEEKRTKRVQVQNKLPNVNKDLFLKLKDQETTKKKVKTSNLLEDDRFKAIFSDARFEVDKSEEAYRLLAPVVSRLDDSKKKKLEKEFVPVSDAESDSDDDNNGRGSEQSDLESEGSSLSEDDGKDWKQAVKEQHKQIRREKQQARFQEQAEKRAAKILGKPKFYEQKDGVEFVSREGWQSKTKAKKNASLAELLEKKNEEGELRQTKNGVHEMVFKSKKSRKQLEAMQAAKEHLKERQLLRRSASKLQKKKLAPKFFMGKRVA